MAASKPRTLKSPNKSATSATTAPLTCRGRPPAEVFINVRVRMTTRDGLNKLKRRLGLAAQGDVLDKLVAAELRRPAK